MHGDLREAASSNVSGRSASSPVLPLAAAFILELVAVGQAADFSSAAKDYVRIGDGFER